MKKTLTFYDKIKTRSGKCFDKEIIYVTFKDGKGRQRFVNARRITENQFIPVHNKQMGERFKQSIALYKQLPNLFVYELKLYTKEYNCIYRDVQIPITAYNIFMKVLLKQPTQIESLEALSEIMGNTIIDWIKNGGLDRVSVDYNFVAVIR